MKTKKRILAIVICIALIVGSLGVLAGCNGPEGQTITFTPNTMPAGIVGEIFEVSAGNAGGVPAAYINFRHTGNLPTGLTLNSNNGIISGTPLRVGISNFSIEAFGVGAAADATPAAHSFSITIGVSNAVTPVLVTPAMETFSIHAPHAFVLPRLALPFSYSIYPFGPVPGSLESHLVEMGYEDEVVYAFYDEASAKLMNLLGFELRQSGVIHSTEVLGDTFNASIPAGQTQEIQSIIVANPQFEEMVTFIPSHPFVPTPFMRVTIKVYAYSSFQKAGHHSFLATKPANVELTIWGPVNQTDNWVRDEDAMQISTPFLRRLARGSVAPHLIWAFRPAGNRTVTFHAVEASDPNHIAGTGELSAEFTLFANGLLHINNAIPANYPVGLRSFTVEARPGGTGLESRFFRAEIEIGYALLLFPIMDLSDPNIYWAERTVELTLNASAGFPIDGARTPTGSNAPITYTAAIDALPMGLSINAQNRLVGTPLRAYGRIGITVTASAPGYADRTSQVFIFINETYVNTDGVFEMLYMHNVDRRAGGGASSASGINMFFCYSVVQNSPHIGASATAIGWHYSNLPPGVPGINPPFEVVFNSDRATTAHLILRMASEIEPFHLSNDSFHVELNGVRINTPPETIIDGDDFRDITFTTNANILAGENILRIRVLPNNFGPYGTGAPMMAHARFSDRSGAVLTWRPDTHNLRRYHITRWNTLSRTGATATPENVFRNPWNI